MTVQGSGESDPEPGANPRSHKVLLAVVIILGILLVVGFAIVIATIASRVSSSGEDTAPPPAEVTPAGDLSVPVPAGYRIEGATGDERRLVLHLSAGPEMPERVMVINTRDGRVVSSVVLTPDGD